ncbi:UNVERIFIED_CONTAM: hypothetical protein GTU68_000009 [Idotea baltica]|nr:hypothetical protein [Idotea baltica]
MISFIKGKIVDKNPAFVVLENNSIGYHINISLNTFGQIQEMTECQLYTHYYISNEQLPILFGFYEIAERNIFLELIKVSGVGTNTARVILSGHNPFAIQQAVLNNDINLLKSIKGIGAKTAQRLVLELRDKFDKITGLDGSPEKVSHTHTEEALSALLMLGFNRSKALSALNKVKKNNAGISSIEDLVKESLKIL